MNESFKHLGAITLLYVEDDPLTREEVVFSLEPFVQKILTAENGVEGIRIFEREHPDIVITDIQMPRMNGIEMARTIRQTDPDLPIVVTTAFNDTDYLMRSIETNITAYETKPLDLMRLLKKLETIAKNIALERENRRMHQALAQFQRAVDESTYIVHLDEKLRIRDLNERFRTLLDLEKQTLRGKPLEEILYPDGPHAFVQFTKAIQNSTEWQGSMALTHPRDREERLYFRVTMFPMDNFFEEAPTFSLFMQDITELVRYRELLQNELSDTRRSLNENLHYLRQYQNIIDEATAICSFLPQGAIRRTDANFERMLEADRKTLADHSFYDICEGVQADLKKAVLLSAQTGEFVHIRTRCKKDDHSKERIAHSIFKPIFRLDGEVEEILGIHQDITELIELNEEIKATQKEILFRLGAVAENHSKETGLHVRRVAEYSRRLAELYGLDSEQCEILYAAAPMHDIGKLAIPEQILAKPGPLTPEEFETMKSHTLKGAEMFRDSDRPFMKAAAIIAGQHHENFDGSGYPYRLAGEAIHIFGRIVAIADVFDALSFKRVYKEPWPLEKVLDFLRANSGIKFDPALIDLFFRHIDEFLRIRSDYA